MALGLQCSLRALGSGFPRAHGGHLCRLHFHFSPTAPERNQLPAARTNPAFLNPAIPCAAGFSSSSKSASSCLMNLKHVLPCILLHYASKRLDCRNAWIRIEKSIGLSALIRTLCHLANNLNGFKPHWLFLGQPLRSHIRL